MYPQSMFRAKIRKHHNFSSENYRSYSREKLQYITWACFRNVKMGNSTSQKQEKYVKNGQGVYNIEGSIFTHF